MIEQDYLMRMLLRFFEALTRSKGIAQLDKDSRRAADTLEEAVSQALEMDGSTLLSLEPESFASVVTVSGTDSRLAVYVARALLLESVYLEESGDSDASSLRAAQARALALSYGFDLPDDPSDFSGLGEAAERESMENGGFSV